MTFDPSSVTDMLTLANTVILSFLGLLKALGIIKTRKGK